MRRIYEVHIQTVQVVKPDTFEIKDKIKVISYEPVDEDYYSLNLEVTAQLKLYGFSFPMEAHTLLMDFNFDHNSISLHDKNDWFKDLVVKAKEIKVMIRDQNIDKVLQ
jgi:hypothetical protein